MKVLSRLCLIILLLPLAIFAAPSNPWHLDRVVVFGDSFSGNGNVANE